MSNGIYLRVSKGKGQDTASQQPDMDRWARAQDEPCETYIDKKTGKTMDRPGFNRLMTDCRLGKIKTIVVWRLDRLGRTAKGLTSLFEELRDLKVNLVSLRDGLDLATTAGRLMANVLASVAAYETEVRAERIQAGLEVAKANGVKLGRKPGQGKGVRVKVNEDQQQVIAHLRKNGNPIAAIARATGLSRPTIYSVIESQKTA